MQKEVSSLSNTFYTILTDKGLQKQAAAQTGGPQIEITHFAVGDGGGSNTVPNGAQTALVNEKWRGAINSISVDEVNTNWIVIEGVVPTDVGDFTIREIGFFDAEGDMVAVGNYPETFKGTTASGVVVDIAIKAIIEVSNADVLKIEVDPSITMASRDYVNKNIASLEQTVNEHSADEAAHGIGNKSTLLTSNKTTIVSAINELFTNVSDGKSLIGGAITDVNPDVIIPTDPTFQQLADVISQMDVNKLAVGTSTGDSSNFVHIRGLSSTPRFVMMMQTNEQHYGDRALAVYMETGSFYKTLSMGSHGSSPEINNFTLHNDGISIRIEKSSNKQISWVAIL